MTISEDWLRTFTEFVRPVYAWTPPAAFPVRVDGINKANMLGLIPLTVGRPTLDPANDVVIAAPDGGFAIAVPNIGRGPGETYEAWAARMKGMVAHEAGHGVHAWAARERDRLEGRGTAGNDIIRELAAILCPGHPWDADTLRGEYVAEAYRRAVTGDVAFAMYPLPPGQLTPYPLEEVRQYFATMPQARPAAEEAKVNIPDPAGFMLSHTLTRGFNDGSLPQFGIHTGVDLAFPLNAPVPTVKSGVVAVDDDDAYYDPNAPATWSGVSVWVQTDDRELWGFCHMTRNVVTKGQRVEAGDLLGYAGSTGASTGVHVHVERRINGVPVDPWEELLMLSQTSLDQIAEVVRKENAASAQAIAGSITAGFNTTLPILLRRAVRHILFKITGVGAAHDVAGMPNPGGAIAYADDTEPLT
jgi:murein DD-endopeptidase MepM/ murein hydrolase activator NlpD